MGAASMEWHAAIPAPKLMFFLHFAKSATVFFTIDDHVLLFAEVYERHFSIKAVMSAGISEVKNISSPVTG